MENTILVGEKFSKASGSYDLHSVMHREIADGLLERLKPLNSSVNILDIGMGTGYLTEKLKQQYPNLKVFGFDCALGMLDRAKQKNMAVSLIQADAKDLPFKNKKFGIVISNLAYQWVVDLESSFREVRRILKDEGKFCFTIFAENTLKELRSAILESLSADIKIDRLVPIGNLPSIDSIERLLKKIGFQSIRINSKIYIKYYSNLLELISWLKGIGANKYWHRGFYSGLAARTFFDSLIKNYEKRFDDNGKVFATFEVLCVELTK